MKFIVATVRPERLEAVQERLAAAKVFRLTISDVQGVTPAARGGAAATYAAGGGQAAAPPRPEPRVKLEVAVNEDFVEATLRAIQEGARGDAAGEHGTVLVLPLEEVIRIRTGERGPAAI
ncbi:MAG: P-II family nitrogen regulator [Planctomycetota bacterium]